MKISSVVLSPEIGGDKAPCAGNGGSIFKHGNAVSADFRAQPEGPGPLLRTPALLIAYLARLNYALRALDCATMTPGATLLIFETASSDFGEQRLQHFLLEARDVVMVLQQTSERIDHRGFVQARYIRFPQRHAPVDRF